MYDGGGGGGGARAPSPPPPRFAATAAPSLPVLRLKRLRWHQLPLGRRRVNVSCR